MPDPSLEKKKLNIKEVGIGGAIVHVWTYYKWWIIIPVIVIGMIVYTVTSYMKETKKEYLKIAMVNAHQDGMDLFIEYSKSIGHEVVVDTTYIHPTNDDSVYLNSDQTTSIQKLTTQYQSGLVDIMVTNSRAAQEYTERAFLDLREVLDESQMKQLEEEGLIYYLDSEEGETVPVGINVTGMEFFEPAYPGSEEMHYLFLSSFTDKKEEEKLILEYLFFQ